MSVFSRNDFFVNPSVMSTHGFWVLIGGTRARIRVSEYDHQVLVLEHRVFHEYSYIVFEYSSSLCKILISLYSVQYCCSISILFKYKIDNKKYKTTYWKFERTINTKTTLITLFLLFFLTHILKLKKNTVNIN
jgi:hypothetical protein